MWTQELEVGGGGGRGGALLQADCHWAEGKSGEILLEHSVIHLPCHVWPLGGLWDLKYF